MNAKLEHLNGECQNDTKFKGEWNSKWMSSLRSWSKSDGSENDSKMSDVRHSIRERQINFHVVRFQMFLVNNNTEFELIAWSRAKIYSSRQKQKSLYV